MRLTFATKEIYLTKFTRCIVACDFMLS